ncbi:hypothetical protein [Chelatococcus asaccharovorans]|uniref:hypothetical protein n=1 Tax=Chelatococcus asaccharovorans TaxID=28210 RepID=UPI00224C74BB|nr:hypothetical protein [Chelatococcus asaccharovorans]CAH1664498.1 conserved hypothetical protein [Chelatococcus asaccharovorans]CAH1682374.1 conserved hypothetical protein [Chelatococcus asaccharovorans]
MARRTAERWAKRVQTSMAGKAIGSKRLGGAFLLCGLAAATVISTHEHAIAQDNPAAVCRYAGDDNMIRPLPGSMLAKAKAAFGSDLAGIGGAPVGIWRCMGGRVMVCLPGGDRHCGRADSQPMATPEASAYCRSHPGSETVPISETGRDTIFAWGCDGAAVKNKGSVRSVDPRGFVKEYWRPLD